MALSAPQTNFGIKQVTFINLETGKPYGKPLQVLESSNLTASAETIKNEGGASTVPWNTQSGATEATLSVSYKEVLPYMSEVTTGAKATDLSAIQLIAHKGDSIKVTATAGTNPIYGTYRLIATGNSTVDIYSIGPSNNNSVDSGEVKKNVTLSTTDTTVSDIGLKIKSNAAPSLTTGDILDIHFNEKAEGFVVDIDKIDPPYVEIHCLTENDSTLTIFKAKATGKPENAERNNFPTYEVTFELSQDVGKPLYRMVSKPKV